MSEKYNVIFLGLRVDTPAARDKLIKTLADTHKFPPEKFSFLRDKQNVPIYSNLEKAVAEKTALWLENLGAVVKVDSEQIQKKQKRAYRKCGECGAFNKINAVYCISCKNDFRLQRSENGSESPERTKKTEEQGAVSSNVFIRSKVAKPVQTNIPDHLNPAGINFDIFSEKPTEKANDKKDGTVPIELAPLKPLGR